MSQPINNQYAQERIYKIILDTLHERSVSFYRVHKDTGIVLATLNNMKKGKGIHIDTLLRLCEYLKITIELHK